MIESGDFSIGSDVWSGISKLIEEAGEVTQVCGKLIAIAGHTEHWDGTDLRERLENELADLSAAIEFVVGRNELDAKRMNARSMEKLELFVKWDKENRERCDHDPPQRTCPDCYPMPGEQGP